MNTEPQNIEQANFEGLRRELRWNLTVSKGQEPSRA